MGAIIKVNLLRRVLILDLNIIYKIIHQNILLENIIGWHISII